MSLLAPLYALGLLAIAGPIVLHLIRRQPKGSVQFSSLIFLSPTPPRLTKRSRITNWLLLLIRITAIVLLALAFARPFLRSEDQTNVANPGRRIAILLDTSASMKRDGLWVASIEALEKTLDELQPNDQVALISFDEEPTLEVDFNDAMAGTLDTHRQLILQSAEQLQATSKATALGTAIQFTSELAMTEPSGAGTRNDINSDDQTLNASVTPSAQIIVISDLQQGSNLESLQAYAWPKQLTLDLRPVIPKTNGNASVTLLKVTKDDRKSNQVRVRVDNTEDSNLNEFQISWLNRDELQVNREKLTIPPGRTRVVNLPSPTADVVAVTVEGDGAEFDNRHYFVTTKPIETEALFFGDLNQDLRNDLFYYLKILPLNTESRSISFRPIEGSELNSLDSAKVPLVVIAKPLASNEYAKLKRYIDSGGTVLFVLGDSQTCNQILQNVNQIGGMSLTGEESDMSDYSMLTDIRYSHRFFLNVAEPQFSDFSKIKFWNHRNLTGLQATEKVLASFDDGSPAIIETKQGLGSLVIFAFGWQPEESQFALSTKFLPLIDSIISDKIEPADPQSVAVGDPVPFPHSETAKLSNDAGETTNFKARSDGKFITEPGIYQHSDQDRRQTFAVNVRASESQTKPLDSEDFERLGVRIGKLETGAITQIRERQLKDQELEKSQGIWQWMLVAALLLLFSENLISGLLQTDRKADPSNQR